jgi:hypothetical protein
MEEKSRTDLPGKFGRYLCVNTLQQVVVKESIIDQYIMMRS